VDPRLLVGLGSSDDASVYAITDDIAVVQTIDFFLPIVDDAETFGRIAAANAISDVYAMGATPITALAVLGWPRSKLPVALAGEVMAGAAAICTEVGISICGGHSIDDAEPKFGLAVTGVAHPRDILRNDTGRAGDLLVLTKPLGVGALAQAVKKGRATAAQQAAATAVMVTLNRSAAEAARGRGVNAATDVTGFALLGHSREMARGAELGVTLWMDALPVLDGAREWIAAGVHPGATRRNLAHFGADVDWGPAVTEIDRKLLADPQTSGGLLLAVPPDDAEALCAALRAADTLSAAVVGQLTAERVVRVRAHK